MHGIIMIPTYNEAQNIGSLIEQIFALPLNLGDKLEVVVVDDNSPDGTAQKVEELQKKFSEKLHLIVRKGERGRGTAGICGFEFCVERKVDCILEMDADFSHDPNYLPIFLNLSRYYDLIIGSRFVQDGIDVKRSWWRMGVSVIASVVYRFFLGLRIQDLSSGYKCYRKELLQKLDFKRFISHGYPIGIETIFYCHQLGARCLEIPIRFEDRRFGKSKFSFKEIIEALSVSFRLFLKRL